jgi:hypothetical protein
MFEVVVGTPYVLDMRNYEAPIPVKVRPGVGGSMNVEASTSVNAIQVISGLPAAVWTEWTPSTVTENTDAVLVGAVSALRFTATTSNGWVEVVR